jgi:hypothetical protein
MGEGPPVNGRKIRVRFGVKSEAGKRRSVKTPKSVVGVLPIREFLIPSCRCRSIATTSKGWIARRGDKEGFGGAASADQENEVGRSASEGKKKK